MNHSEKLAIAAHLHVLLRRKTGQQAAAPSAHTAATGHSQARRYVGGIR
jgi:hypothetical protein